MNDIKHRDRVETPSMMIGHMRLIETRCVLLARSLRLQHPPHILDGASASLIIR